MICNNCKNTIEDDAKVCPICNSEITEEAQAKTGKKSIFKKWWFWVIIVVAIIVIFVIAVSGGSNKNNNSVDDSSLSEEISQIRAVDTTGFSVSCSKMNEILTRKASAYAETDFSCSEETTDGRYSLLINGVDSSIDVVYYKDNQKVEGESDFDAVMLIGDGKSYASDKYVAVSIAMYVLTDPFVSSDYTSDSIGSSAYGDSLNKFRDTFNAYKADKRAIELGTSVSGFMRYYYTIQETNIYCWATTRTDDIFYPIKEK